MRFGVTRFNVGAANPALADFLDIVFDGAFNAVIEAKCTTSFNNAYFSFQATLYRLTLCLIDHHLTTTTLIVGSCAYHSHRSSCATRQTAKDDR